MTYNILAGIHIGNQPEDIISLNIDFDKNVVALKQQISERIKLEPKNIELMYNGKVLNDDLKISGTIKANGVVHCFKKTKREEISIESTSTETTKPNVTFANELFSMISHIQISVNSRVTILQKILNEYPEFRRNLGAQAFIRDSVLFNTLHQPEVINKVCEAYPIIVEAAPFIVKTIKKELARTASSSFSEPATDSPTSSEEENSMSTSSNFRQGDSRGNTSDNASVRAISRQQLQAALSQIGFGSHNSLSNIAQRNTETSSATSAPLSNSASGERISSEMLRLELQRALNALSEQPLMNATENSPRMDLLEDPVVQGNRSISSNPADSDESNDIPSNLHNHQYVEQLRTMAQMGFLNHRENLTYLEIANGNIEHAVNLLMSGGLMN